LGPAAEDETGNVLAVVVAVFVAVLVQKSKLLLEAARIEDAGRLGDCWTCCCGGSTAAVATGKLTAQRGILGFDVDDAFIDAVDELEDLLVCDSQGEGPLLELTNYAPVSDNVSTDVGSLNLLCC